MKKFIPPIVGFIVGIGLYLLVSRVLLADMEQGIARILAAVGISIAAIIGLSFITIRITKK